MFWVRSTSSALSPFRDRRAKKVAAMSDQEEIKTEEQPAEADAAGEPEQKPDTSSQGETPEEAKEPEPSPAEAEAATEGTEQAETEQTSTEPTEQEETEPAQEEPAADQGEKEPAQEPEPAAPEIEEPAQEEPAADEGEKEPAADEGEKEPAATEGEKEPAADEGEKEPAAKEGEKEPAATEGEKEPAADEGEKEPAAKEGEKEPAADEGGKEPAADEGEKEPAAKEGEAVAATEEEEEPEEEEPDDGVPIALVTGASGYIATHLLKQLLEQGRYRIRGTVRNKKREDKVKPLLDLVPDAKYPLRLVEADLSKPETWKKAVNRCTYVFHVASPFPVGKPKEAEIIRTAVEGTTNVLQACADAGTVKRVVVTSSVAAVSCGTVGNPELPPDYVYTEKDWSLETACGPYEKSKLKAEQAAWEFVKNLDESKRFELAVMNPGYVQGPLLSANSGEGSKEFCQRILNGKLPAIPDISSPIVDVRDVAAAHIAAMEKSEAAGNRYILTNRTLHFKEMAQIIDTEFRPQGYKFSTKNMPKVVMWVGKLFDSGMKQLYSSLGKSVELSNERMVKELGIQPRPVEESIIDTCYSLIDHGLAKKTTKYLGHPSTRPPPEEPQTNEEAAKTEGQEAAEAGSGEDKPSESQAAEGGETKEAKQSESEEVSEKKEEVETADQEGATTEQDKPAQEEKESKDE